MIDILADVGLICLGALISTFLIFKKNHKQTCFVYCPRCHNELVSSESFVEDHDGIVEYKCDNCGEVSFWDFAHYPVPYLLEYDINTYPSVYLWMNEDECDPDTMVKFEQRVCGKEE